MAKSRIRDGLQRHRDSILQRLPRGRREYDRDRIVLGPEVDVEGFMRSDSKESNSLDCRNAYKKESNFHAHARILIGCRNAYKKEKAKQKEVSPSKNTHTVLCALCMKINKAK